MIGVLNEVRLNNLSGLTVVQGMCVGVVVDVDVDVADNGSRQISHPFPISTTIFSSPPLCPATPHHPHHYQQSSIQSFAQNSSKGSRSVFAIILGRSRLSISRCDSLLPITSSSSLESPQTSNVFTTNFQYPDNRFT